MGKVNQRTAVRLKLLSSNRWIGSGAAVIGVGGLFAISWRIYVIQAKLPFWSWPGILGVAVMGVGLVMIITGFFLREDEGRPAPS
jgi:hypothetical protein